MSCCSGEPLTGEAQLQNRNARRVELDNQRRRGAHRKRAQGSLRYGGELGYCVCNLDGRLKINLDDRNAVERLGLNMLNVVDRSRKGTFRNGDNAVRHVRGREAGVVPDNADDRNIDIGKNVGRGIHDRDRPKNEKKNCENDEGVRPSEREADNPHLLEVLLNRQKRHFPVAPPPRRLTSRCVLIRVFRVVLHLAPSR